MTRRNIYIADLTGQGVLSAPGLREDGARVIRARYPNGNPERGFGSRLRASGWVPNKLPPQPDIEVSAVVPYLALIPCQ